MAIAAPPMPKPKKNIKIGSNIAFSKFPAPANTRCISMPLMITANIEFLLNEILIITTQQEMHTYNDPNLLTEFPVGYCTPRQHDSV